MGRRVTGAVSLEPSTVALEAGQHAAFGAAALVGILAVGASFYNSTTPPAADVQPAPLPVYSEAPAANADVLSTEEAVFEPEAEAWGMTATPVVFNVPANMLRPIEAAPLTLAPTIDPGVASAVAFRDDALRLSQPILFSRPDEEATLDSGGRAHAPERMSERLEDMAADLTYETPELDSRDIAVFVAADDEAVSWSLNASSPNYGNVAYEEDRVEVGDLSAGVALTTDDVRIAAAYVERDLDMRLGRGFEDHDQRYAGVIVTFKN
jgi:hypothetical protein